jgi:DNA-binding Lrp family transcriptional regulator
LEAIVLVNVEAGALWQVVEAVVKIDGVKTVYGVTGQFDAVVLTEFSDLNDMVKIIGRINHVEGVLHTQTLMTVPPPEGAGRVTPSLLEEERAGPNSYADR